MELSGLETPVKKRSRGTTPFSISPHRHKRARSTSVVSSTPKVVRFEPSSHGGKSSKAVERECRFSVEEVDEVIMIPASPAQLAQPPLQTPAEDIDNPFARLSIKTPGQKENDATPATKNPEDRTKSAKKSATKTPGKVSIPKAFAFRIKVGVC
jgi:hypothetical protein